MLSRTSRLLGTLASAAAVISLALPASAQYTFTATNGDKSAKAVFSTVTEGTDTELQIAITNTGAAAHDNADVLTAILFNVAGQTLTQDFAQASAYINPTSPSSPNPGGNWQYLTSVAGFFSTAAHMGLSTSGFNSQFGPNGNFANVHNGAVNGVNLDGVGYGIVSGLDNPTHGLQQNGPQIDPTATFYLKLSPGGLDTTTGTAFTNISFVYGTALSDATCVGNCGGDFLPEPAYYQLASLLGLGGLSLLRLRRRKTTAA